MNHSITGPEEPFRRISVDEARRMMESLHVQVIDVREPKEFVTGHIARSTLIPVDQLLSRSNELDEETDLIFVCAAGVRSALASEMAAAVGRTNIYNMEGGMEEWLRRGYPVEL